MTRRLFALSAPAAGAIAVRGEAFPPARLEVRVESHQHELYIAELHCRVEISSRLEEDLAKVPGVEYATSIGRYTVRIHRGHAFSWEEVEAGCLAVVRAHKQKEVR